MKKLFVFVLLFAAGLVETSHADKVKIPAVEIQTAIDMADLLKSGSSYTDIALKLSGQPGFDREAALSKGKSDQQIINYLITTTSNPGSNADNRKSMSHKLEGDKYSKELKYDKAAVEYTLAIRNSKDNETLYKLRGDNYKQYLITRLPASSVSGTDETNHASLNMARKLLCSAIYADYKKAMVLNKMIIQKNNTNIRMLENQMSNKDLAIANRSDVAPYHNKAAGNIQGMREMDRLYRSQRSANHFNLNIRKAIADYKLVCREEDAALRKSLIIAKDNKRDKKWVKYEETGETSYFYDKSGIEKSKDYLTLWTRSEQIDDEQANDIARVRINCKKRLIGIVEYSIYGEAGNLVKNQKFEDVTMKNVIRGATEEKLFKGVCN